MADGHRMLLLQYCTETLLLSIPRARHGRSLRGVKPRENEVSESRHHHVTLFLLIGGEDRRYSVCLE